MFATSKKTSLCSLNKFFPRVTPEGVLKESDALAVRVAKEFSIYRVICNAHLLTAITINYVNDFYAIGKNWQTMSFKEVGHDHVVWAYFNVNNCVEGVMKFAQFLFHAAAEDEITP